MLSLLALGCRAVAAGMPRASGAVGSSCCCLKGGALNKLFSAQLCFHSSISK